MSPEELKALGRRLTDELLNQGDLSVADELIDTHYTANTPPCQNNSSGPVGVKQLITYLRRAFPDLHSHVDDQIAEGGKLVQRITLSGTHEGRPFIGMPATGKSMTINLVNISRVGPDGKFCEGWTFIDQSSFSWASAEEQCSAAWLVQIEPTARPG